MSSKEHVIFLSSILLSLLFWGILYSWTASFVLVTSILIHESGHYWRMGKEGITQKRMFFIPLLGAIAQSKEPWPSLLAEARIALAGPIIGSTPALVALIFWVIDPLPVFAASALLISSFNLFNLVIPIPILDGGRVIKTILWSMHPSLRNPYFVFSFVLIVLSVLFINQLIIIGLVLFFFTNYELNNLKTAEAALEKIRNNNVFLTKYGQDYVSAFAEEERELMLLAEPARMTKQELTTMILAHLTITGLYTGIVLTVYQATGLSPLSPNLFNYFA